MDEFSGPGYYNCPQQILSLLSPTENDYANNWREKCLSSVTNKKKSRTIGSKIKLAKPASFRNGVEQSIFTIERYGKKGIAYRGENGTLYKLRKDSLINCETVN